MVNDQFKTFSINLNAQHVNEMTPFDLASSTVIRYSRVTFIAFSEMKNCVYFQVWLFMSSDEVVVESCHATKK